MRRLLRRMRFLLFSGRERRQIKTSLQLNHEDTNDDLVQDLR
jgi:hypothetical protein